MEIIKIKDKVTGAIKEVNKALADDFIGTGKFVLVEKEAKEENKSFAVKNEAK